MRRLRILCFAAAICLLLSACGSAAAAETKGEAPGNPYIMPEFRDARFHGEAATDCGALRLDDSCLDQGYVRTNNAEAVGIYTDVLTALYTENANYDVRVINGTFVITAANNPNPNPPQPNPNPPQPNPNPPQPQPQPEPEPEVEPEAGPEVKPEVTPEEPQPAAPDAGPVEEIADEETPLAMGGAWALVNLILTVLTVLGSILLLIGYIGKKQKEREDENGNVILNAEGEAETDDIKKKGGWRLASIIPAVAAVIAFILTENMRLPMVLVDKWTLLMVIIALVQLLVAYFSKKKTQEPEQPEQMVANA